MDPLTGKVVYKLEDDINTDQILAGRYLVLTGDEELAEHCFEGHIPDWQARVKKGDILVARENFGCGSSREHAPVALKGSGLAAVVAESLGRIFYRNSIAVGLPVVQAPGIYAQVEEGDRLTIDLGKGIIRNHRTGAEIKFDRFPDFIQEYLDQGGLANFVRTRLSSQG